MAPIRGSYAGLLELGSDTKISDGTLNRPLMNCLKKKNYFFLASRSFVALITSSATFLGQGA